MSESVGLGDVGVAGRATLSQQELMTVLLQEHVPLLIWYGVMACAVGVGERGVEALAFLAPVWAGVAVVAWVWLANRKRMDTPISFALTRAGLEQTSSARCWSVPWSDFEGWLETRAGFVLLCTGQTFYLPKRAFPDSELLSVAQMIAAGGVRKNSMLSRPWWNWVIATVLCVGGTAVAIFVVRGSS